MGRNAAPGAARVELTYVAPGLRLGIVAAALAVLTLAVVLVASATGARVGSRRTSLREGIGQQHGAVNE